ncbi:hypothetical protein V6N11_038874 [Hibiscus sabdariffa]|uniref:Uncharacterized protein n=1 Tax=Hibiscus sabdariffa TaxID=183260 RepID=A0ABR2SL91_9ROSI
MDPMRKGTIDLVVAKIYNFQVSAIGDGSCQWAFQMIAVQVEILQCTSLCKGGGNGSMEIVHLQVQRCKTWLKLPIHCGMAPLKLLRDKSRISRDFALHTSEIFPLKLLFETDRNVILGGNTGRSLSMKFDDKSRTVRFTSSDIDIGRLPSMINQEE